MIGMIGARDAEKRVWPALDSEQRRSGAVVTCRPHDHYD